MSCLFFVCFFVGGGGVMEESAVWVFKDEGTRH